MAETVKQTDHSKKGRGRVLHLMRSSHDLSGNLEEQGHLLDFERHRQGEGRTVNKGLLKTMLSSCMPAHCDFKRRGACALCSVAAPKA